MHVDYIPYVRMGWLLIGNDAEGIGRGLILGTISAFVW